VPSGRGSIALLAGNDILHKLLGVVPVAHAELVVDDRDAVFHRLVSDKQPFRDLVVVVVLQEQVEDLRLSRPQVLKGAEEEIELPW